MYPYSTDLLEGLHPDGWAAVEPSAVPLDELKPTQSHVVIDRLQALLAGNEPETGDPYAHVVLHDRRLYVHDGHHRYVIALARGRRTLLARVVQVESS